MEGWKIESSDVDFANRRQVSDVMTALIYKTMNHVLRNLAVPCCFSVVLLAVLSSSACTALVKAGCARVFSRIC